MMKKLSISLSGHLTSVSLEPEFIQELETIAKKQKRSVASIISSIDLNRAASSNLSSAIRIWILHELKK
ncbi:MAG: ribbon-helix-helix domain-containing protein [Alphaproteobacteria bacterium]